MKKTFFALCLAPCALFAGTWNGLDESKYYSGPKITEADLQGKVVLVDEWGVNCPPCRALLPAMESLWAAYKNKHFVLLGSHRQGHSPDKVKELVRSNKLTYPIYERAGLAGEPPGDGGLPYMYVVNHRGKVVYAGRDHKAATVAVVEAIMKVDAAPELVAGVTFNKYKSIEKQLVLGKPLKSVMSSLERDVKRAQAKRASTAQKEQAEEAAAILEAIKKGAADVKEEIEALKTTNPPKAVQLIGLFTKSFPAEGAQYKAELPELTVKAKEFVAAAKAKEKAEKAAKGKKR